MALRIQDVGIPKKIISVGLYTEWTYLACTCWYPFTLLTLHYNLQILWYIRYSWEKIQHKMKNNKNRVCDNESWQQSINRNTEVCDCVYHCVHCRSFSISLAIPFWPTRGSLKASTSLRHVGTPAFCTWSTLCSHPASISVRKPGESIKGLSRL